MSDREPPPSDAIIRGRWVWCPRCRKPEALPLPIAVDALVHWVRFHAEQHRYCRDHLTPLPPPSELPNPEG